MRRFRLPLVLAIGWTLVLGLGLLLPGRVFPAPPPGATTAVHVVLFAGLVGLWGWAVPRATILVVVVAVFVAVGSEAFQAEIVPGRGVETRDLWADFAGIVIGWGIAVWHRRHQRRWPRSERGGASRRPRTASTQPQRDVDSSVHA